MPVNVVRTPEEEIVWERAKARAREEYPDATGERFYLCEPTRKRKCEEPRDA